MKPTPEELRKQIHEKTTDELVAMLSRPQDWLEELLEAALAELKARNVEVEAHLRQHRQLEAARTQQTKRGEGVIMFWTTAIGAVGGMVAMGAGGKSAGVGAAVGGLVGFVVMFFWKGLKGRR